MVKFARNLWRNIAMKRSRASCSANAKLKARSLSKLFRENPTGKFDKISKVRGKGCLDGRGVVLRVIHYVLRCWFARRVRGAANAPQLKNLFHRIGASWCFACATPAYPMPREWPRFLVPCLADDEKSRTRKRPPRFLFSGDKTRGRVHRLCHVQQFTLHSTVSRELTEKEGFF